MADASACPNFESIFFTRKLCRLFHEFDVENILHQALQNQPMTLQIRVSIES